MSQPPEQDDDQIFSGPALGTDGALSRPGQSKVLPSVQPPGEGPPRLEPLFDQTAVPTPNPAFGEAPPLHLATVELAELPRPPPSDPEPLGLPRERPPRVSSPDIRWGRQLLRLALLGVLGAGGWVVATGKLPALKLPSWDALKLGDKPREEVAEKRVGTPAPSLLVLSEPSGAKVLIGGKEVGVTPWAGDNVWPAGPLRIEVRKAGYRAWEGTTEGGAQRTVEATLQRR